MIYWSGGWVGRLSDTFIKSVILFLLSYIIVGSSPGPSGRVTLSPHLSLAADTQWGERGGSSLLRECECRCELEVVHNEKADTSFIYGTYDTVLMAHSAITPRS